MYRCVRRHVRWGILWRCCVQKPPVVPYIGVWQFKFYVIAFVEIGDEWYVRAISSVKFSPNDIAADIFAGAADSSRCEYRPSTIPSTTFGTYSVVSEGR